MHLHILKRFIRPKIHTKIDLRLLGVFVAVVVILPMAIILGSMFQPEVEIWEHMVETLLVDMIRNTLFLCVGVLVGTFILGVGSAWLTAVCEFPGRSFFNWVLMMPLAIPTYVFAFVFIGLLDFSGPLQTFLRAQAGHPLAWFPPIRSTGGVILVFSLALYPYVYLLARNAFKTQGKRILEISQALGHSPRKSFFKLALPMARPWIAGGLMLVLMETLAVKIFELTSEGEWQRAALPAVTLVLAGLVPLVLLNKKAELSTL
jgi:iron(III) transport system permease protein